MNFKMFYLAKTSHEFFANACKKANQHHFDRLDDKIVFIIDSIINELLIVLTFLSLFKRTCL